MTTKTRSFDDRRHCHLSGPWGPEEIDSFLDTTVVPMRLAVNTAAGFPAVTPLWFLWREGCLWAAAKPGAAVIKRLKADGRCGFDISPETPPYCGIRGQGMAAVIPDGLAVLSDLVERYLGAEKPEFRAWLLRRSADECAVRIVPERLTSWDFRKRMRK